MITVILYYLNLKQISFPYMTPSSVKYETLVVFTECKIRTFLSRMEKKKKKASKQNVIPQTLPEVRRRGPE